ncbi:MAG: hypothetical protein A2046_08150 [Bacteroidetes bacterium GWA2_30_7]|nr:MAG: hypothetical protein A2046_08150 [Bacteroidetes bacterium GWA2_30_7]
MKTLNLYLAIIIFISNINSSSAIIYYATRAGNFTDQMWSTTSKTGKPVTTVPGQTDSIVIDYAINLDIDLVIHMTGILIINETGSLTSTTKSLEIKNGGALEVYGTLQVYNFTLDNSSNIVIAEGVTVTVYNDFTNKNNTDGVTFDGFLDVQGDYYNGNKSVIGGCGQISIAGSFYNWGTAFETSGQEGTGPFSIICNGVLPINLVDYKIKCTKSGTYLEWSTASETNNNYFSIEKSIDLKSWKTVSTLSGAINSNKVRNYSFIDTESNDVNTYYRIKQTDLDGKFDYFDMLCTTCKLNNNKLDFIGLSASENMIKLIITTDGLEPVLLTITDLNGTKKVTKEINPVKGENIINIESPTQRGLYVVNMIQNEKSSSKRLYIN